MAKCSPSSLAKYILENVGKLTEAEGDGAGCSKVCMPKNTNQSQNNCWSNKVSEYLMLALSCDFLSIPLLLLRLRVCNSRGGGLRRRIPDPRCDQAKPSQQEVRLLFSALPALGLRAGHAPGPASVPRGRPGVHRADARLGRHRHGDGRRRVSQLPVSGIYP